MSRAKRVAADAPKVLAGTSNEVGQLLRRGTAHRALAITFAESEQSVILESALRRVTEFLPQIVRQRQQDTVEKIVGALLPDIALPEAELAQARMMIDAKSTILRSGDFLPAGEIAKLADFSSKNPSAQPNKWKKDGAIFAIQHKGIDYFPLYGLNPDENYRPYRALAKILRIFGEAKSAWEIAFWFAGLSSFLDDRRPQDLLAGQSELVIAAARDEVQLIQHG